jgi:hypothetical protein
LWLCDYADSTAAIAAFTAASASARVSTPIARSLQNQRMDDAQEDFAAKLTVIEWEANLVLEDLPPSALRDRVQNIATVGRLLRLRLDVGSINDEQEDFAAKLLLIETEASLVLKELPPSVTRDRLQHIATIAQLLRARLDAASTRVYPHKGFPQQDIP